MIKGYNKNIKSNTNPTYKANIVNRIFELIPNQLKDNIMFITFGGSIAYEFDFEESDIDVQIFIDYDKNLDWEFIEDPENHIDIFVYYKNYYKKFFRQEREVSKFEAKIYIDCLVNLDKNTLYLNDKYIDDFNWIKNFNFNNHAEVYFRNCYKYFSDLFYQNQYAVKSYYHIIRIRGKLDNYLKHKDINDKIPDKYISEINFYKHNYDSQAGENFKNTVINRYLSELNTLLKK